MALKAYLRYYAPLLFILGLLLTSMPLELTAQQKPGGETDTTKLRSFRQKEEEMIRVINRQMPKLKRMEKELKSLQNQLASWEDTLKYSSKIPQYRDEAMRDIARIQRRNEKIYDKIKDMNMTWFRYLRDLMAVYTRYGELKIAGKVNDHLKGFLQKHRKVMYKIEDNLNIVQDNKVQVDFLLNQKLN
jgi:septal ring factor EnvC (AmiA/AmiB activator)